MLIDDLEAISKMQKHQPGPFPEPAFTVWQKLSAVRLTENGRPGRTVHAIGAYDFIEHVRTHCRKKTPRSAAKLLIEDGPPFLPPGTDPSEPDQHLIECLKQAWRSLGPAIKDENNLLRLYEQEKVFKSKTIPPGEHFTLDGLKEHDDYAAERAKKLDEQTTAELASVEDLITVIV